MEHGFQPGDVVRYETLDRPNRWCREGTAIAERRNPYRVVLVDTFWSGGTEAHVLTDEETATAELRFNLNDYDELDRYSGMSQATWHKYATKDRAAVTSQHGLRKRWFILKGATEDLATQIVNQREKIAECQSKFQSARNDLRYAEQELERLLTLAPNTQVAG